MLPVIDLDPDPDPDPAPFFASVNSLSTSSYISPTPLLANTTLLDPPSYPGHRVVPLPANYVRISKNVYHTSALLYKNQSLLAYTNNTPTKCTCTDMCRISSTRADPTNARVCQNFALYTECNRFNCSLPSTLQSRCYNRRLTNHKTVYHQQPLLRLLHSVNPERPADC